MPVRVAELMAVVASAGDFAKGYAEEQALRTCRIGMWLADVAGLDAEDRQAVFYLSLLRFVGCTATASEMAAALGDEVAVSAAFAAADPRNLRSVVGTAAGLVGGQSAHSERNQQLRSGSRRVFPRLHGRDGGVQGRADRPA